MTIFYCEICNNTKFSKITSLGFQFDKEIVVRCKNCELIQLLNSGIKANENYYKSGKFNSEIRGFNNIDKIQFDIRTKRAEKRFKLLLKLFSNLNGKRFLEIGCGFGPLLNLLNTNLQCQVCGVEPSKNFAEFGNKIYKSNFIFSGDYQDYGNFQKQDFILIYQVIEHIENYDTFFERLEKNIHEETNIIVEFPDLYQALKNRKYLSKGYFQKSHLYDYDPYTLSILFKKYGYEIKKYIPTNEKGNSNDKNSIMIIAKAKGEILNAKYKKYKVTSFTIFFKIKLFHFIYSLKERLRKK